MKKILSVFLVASILVACDDSKKEPTTPIDTKTDTAATTTTADSKKETPTTTTTTTTTTAPAPAGLEVPKFTDPEVQKFAEDYAAYAAMAIKWKDDLSKLEEVNTTKGTLTTRRVELATKKKLPKSDEEKDKLDDFISKTDDMVLAADSE